MSFRSIHVQALALACTSALPLLAHAAPQATDLDEVVVTANRTAVTVNDARVVQARELAFAA